MKYRLLTVLAFLTLLAGFTTGTASAHVLKTDGTIGAVLHVEPDDNPTTGKLVSYILSFSDDANKLDISKCDCLVRFQENGRTIASRPLQVTDPTDSIDSFTFPRADVYTLQVTGRPTTAGAFQPFTLNYLLRVTGGSGALSGRQPFPRLLWLGLAMVLAVIGLAAYALQGRRGVNYKKQLTKEKP